MSLTLQGHIWRTGFEKNELEGVVFEDVPEALEKWHSLGIKVIFLFPPFYVVYLYYHVIQKPLFGVDLSDLS